MSKHFKSKVLKRLRERLNVSESSAERLFDTYFQIFFEELEKGNDIQSFKLGYFKKRFQKPDERELARDCIVWTISPKLKQMFDEERKRIANCLGGPES